MKSDEKRIDEKLKELKDEEFTEKERKKVKNWPLLLVPVIILVMVVTMCRAPQWVDSLDSVPPFSKDAFVVIDRNVPNFEDDQLVTQCYVEYSELDSLGRAGAVMACIGPESVAQEAKPVPESITPTGFRQAAYDSIDGGVLYVRTELISNYLVSQEPDEKNVVTGTAMQQSEGLRYVENLVAKEISNANVHVVYRVTPIYKGNDLVASGFEVEALSIEDQGTGVCIHLYVYNAQKGVTIDYATGESRLAE